MRFFISLDLPDKSEQELITVQQQVLKLIPGAKLTEAGQLHLTIAFIGEQPDNLREKLVEAMKNAAYDIPAFTVTPAYIDGFPELHHAHTLWVGVKGDIDKLFVIRERVKDELAKIGLIVDERRYIPHIAIAKTNHLNLTPFQENQLQELMLQQQFQPIKINNLKLFESVPNEGFHQHNTLATVPLEPGYQKGRSGEISDAVSDTF